MLEEDSGAEFDTVGDHEYPVWALLESPDLDMDAPDVTKTWTRLSLKTFQNRSDRATGSTDPLDFTIYLSSDQGWSWKRALTMSWPTTVNNLGERVRSYNEGKVDFRATGSTIRFKCVSSAEIPKWKLSEYVLIVTGRGLQIDV